MQKKERTKLTPKQEAFCYEYNKSGNATDAARKAGYKDGNSLAAIGNENLRKPLIASRVRELREARNQRLELEADWELKRALELYETCLQTGETMVANQVLNTIGKLRGKFVTKLEHSVADDYAQRLERLRNGDVE